MGTTLVTQCHMKPTKAGEGWVRMQFLSLSSWRKAHRCWIFFAQDMGSRSREAVGGPSASPASSAILKPTVRRSVWRGPRPVGRRSAPHTHLYDTLRSSGTPYAPPHTHTQRDEVKITPNTDIGDLLAQKVDSVVQFDGISSV